MRAWTRIARSYLGIFLALCSRAVEAVSKFGLYALAARMLGGDEAGKFFLCLSVVHLAATMARMGLERPLMRHVAAERAVERSDLACRKALHGGAAILVSSLVIGMVIDLAAGRIAADLFRMPGLTGDLRVAGVLVPLTNLVYAAGYVLIGLERGAIAQLLMNAVAPLAALVALLAGMDDALHLLAAYGLAYAGAWLSALALIVHGWRRGSDAPSAADGVTALDDFWRSAPSLYLFELGQAFLLSLPVLALGRYSDAASLSAFSIASRLSMLVATVVLSIGQLASPLIARHFRRGEAREMWIAYRHARMATVALCVPLLAIIIVGASPLMTLLGSASPHAVLTLRLLAAGQIPYCLWPFSDVLLSMTGHGAILRRLIMLQVGICLTLAIALVPPLGMLGAAVVSFAQWTVIAAAGNLAMRRVLIRRESW